ncbi:MAG: hypothetical protein GY925_17265 [Actinomycetia bacterium]|nr:hypothetical protein [Actinomycetes bacterium]
MVWAATADAMSPAELLCRVASQIPASHDVTLRHEPWGCWLVAASRSSTPAQWLTSGRWLVIGSPTTSVYGLPEPSLPLAEVVERIGRFGPRAVTLFSGPVAAISLDSGEWHCALNGLLAPGRLPDDRRISTLSAPVRDLPPEARPVDDHSPAFSYQRLVGEIAEHLPELGPRFELHDPTAHDVVLGDRLWSSDVFEVAGDALVSWPSNLSDVLADPVLFDRARSRSVPELVWRAERAGRTLYAPFLERVVLDQVGFGRRRAAS